MNRDELIAIISKLVAEHQSIDGHFDVLAKTLGVRPEIPFFDDVFMAFDSYTAAVSALVGDTFGRITWFIHENDYGKSKYTAKPPKGRTRKVRTVADLVDIIEADL